MRLFPALLLACTFLAVPANVWAEAAQDKDQQAAAPEEEKVPGLNAPVLKPRPALNALPDIKPKQIDTRPKLLIPQDAKQQAKDAPPLDANGKPGAKPVPRNRQPRPPFWIPRQQPGNLSPASVYRLDGMGKHVQLTPALQYYLNRSGVAVNPTTQATAATAPQTFYPGVSRLPPEKPFDNLQPQPNAFERYWPLMLQGYQDPKTGIIIWSLP